MLMQVKCFKKGFWTEIKTEKGHIPLWSGQLVVSLYSCALYIENGKHS